MKFFTRKKEDKKLFLDSHIKLNATQKRKKEMMICSENEKLVNFYSIIFCFLRGNVHFFLVIQLFGIHWIWILNFDGKIPVTQRWCRVLRVSVLYNRDKGMIDTFKMSLRREMTHLTNITHTPLKQIETVSHVQPVSFQYMSKSKSNSLSLKKYCFTVHRKQVGGTLLASSLNLKILIE